MKKIVISVLGTDRPGIVSAVSRILFENSCNIEDVSQTILQTEFTGIFIASIPEVLRPDDLLMQLQTNLETLGLHLMVKPLEATDQLPTLPVSEPFVITTTGPDRLGLVAAITGVIAEFGANITNLRAAFRGGDDPCRNTMIYEVDVPASTDLQSFRKALGERAKKLRLELSLQHRDIFEAIHRI
ncbi:MAG TPA: amino acid-binding protein [Desulfobacterales bacterium]|nr:amino acid-binding protein [Desulfobacterales bacterium]